MRRRLLVLAVLVPVVTLAGAAAAEAATLRPNTTTDEMTPHDGRCSLREAVDAANSPGTKTDCGKASLFSNLVVLGAKKYQLSIPPGSGDSDANCLSGATVPDQNASGDLCVTSTSGLTITGRGPTTIIAGLSPLKDRLMMVAPEASVSLVALNMEGGHAPDGAASTGACAPPPVPVNNGANGGAIYNTGSLFTMVVTFQGNSAGAGGAGDDTTGSNGCAGGSGGAIYNDGTSKLPGSLTLQNTMLIANVAGGGGAGGSPSGSVAGGNGGAGGSGGGIANQKGSLLVVNASFALNKAAPGGQGGTGGSSNGNGGNGGNGARGGGIYSAGGSLTVTNGTFAGNQAGSGGNGGAGGGSGAGGNGGDGASGGGVAVFKGASGLRNATVASNVLGLGGSGGSGSPAGSGGKNGIASGIFVQSSTTAHNMRLQNTIVTSSFGLNCLGSSGSAITDGGHNLSFGDTSCPAVTNGNPKLKAFADYGGFTGTLALAPGSAAIDKVPRTGAGCPSTDQRTVRRPQGSACDIGAFEFARPKIEIDTPRNGARYKRGARVRAFFLCKEGTVPPAPSPIASCKGTVASGHRINTSTLGRKSFKVTATDKSGNKASKTVHYTVIR